MQRGSAAVGLSSALLPALGSGSMDKAQLCPAPGVQRDRDLGGAVAHPGTEVVSCAAVRKGL